MTDPPPGPPQPPDTETGGISIDDMGGVSVWGEVPGAARGSDPATVEVIPHHTDPAPVKPADPGWMPHQPDEPAPNLPLHPFELPGSDVPFTGVGEVTHIEPFPPLGEQTPHDPELGSGGYHPDVDLGVDHAEFDPTGSPPEYDGQYDEQG